MAAPNFWQVLANDGQVIIRARLCAQAGNGASCGQHRLEIDLGSRVCFAAFAIVAEGFGGLEHRRNYLGQPVNLWLLETALRNPRRTQPDTARTRRRRIAGNGVAVASDTYQIKYPR